MGLAAKKPISIRKHLQSARPENSFASFDKTTNYLNDQLNPIQARVLLNPFLFKNFE
jgi:hypothetical protein